ncbi:MAG: hypothetical protein AAF770_00380 [Bacteroidota bacterium]
MKKTYLNSLLPFIYNLIIYLGHMPILAVSSKQEASHETLPQSHLTEAIFLANPYLLSVIKEKASQSQEEATPQEEKIAKVIEHSSTRHSTISSKELVEIFSSVNITYDSPSREKNFMTIIEQLSLKNTIGTYVYCVQSAISALDKQPVILHSEIKFMPIITLRIPIYENDPIRITESQPTNNEVWVPISKAFCYAQIMITPKQEVAIQRYLEKRDEDPKEILLAERKEILRKAGIPSKYHNQLENPHDVQLRVNQNKKKNQQIQVRFYKKTIHKGQSPNLYVPIQVMGNKKGKKDILRSFSFRDRITKKSITLKLISFIIYNKIRQRYDVFTKIGSDYYAYVWDCEEKKWEVKVVSEKRFYEKSESSDVYMFYYKRYTQSKNIDKNSQKYEELPYPLWITLSSIGTNILLLFLLWRVNRSP